MDKQELVGWVAEKMYNLSYWCNWEDWESLSDHDRLLWADYAKQILSHPDLGIITKRSLDGSYQLNELNESELAWVIPLAEALKEVQE